jgi:hypothetical protein
MRQKPNHADCTDWCNAQERTAHLVDLDNLTKGEQLTADSMASLAHAYAMAAQYCNGDLSIVATSHHSFPINVFEWPFSAQRLVKSGKDGADQVLCAQVDGLLQVTGINRVVIGSGDHYFVPAVSRLQTAGIHVHAVAHKQSMATALRLAVNSYSYIEPATELVAA